jgi:serine phosphatase RsbU (regulator of sigma subunit)
VQQGIRALTTATMVGFYSTDSNLCFAYANHAPVFLRRKNFNEWQPLELDAKSTRHPNVPVGVIPDTGFDQQQLPLASGD